MKLDYLPSFFTLFYSLPSKGSISELSGLVLKQTPFSDTFVTQTLPRSCEAWVLALEGWVDNEAGPIV